MPSSVFKHTAGIPSSDSGITVSQGASAPGATVPGALEAPLDGVSADSKAASRQIEGLLASGFPLLRFPGELETRFQSDASRSRQRLVRSATWGAVLLFGGSLITDWFLVPDRFDLAVLLRLGIYIPACFLGHLWQVHRASARQREWLIFFAAILATLVTFALCLSSDDPQAMPYLSSVALVVLYSNAVVRMRFWMAVLLDVLIGIGFAIAVLAVPGAPVEIMLPAGLVLLSTTTFALMASYTLERDERQNWLLHLRERSLTQALEQANKQLDAISRTDLLTQVANRRHFDDFYDQVWMRAERDGSEVSLLMVDIDHFKAYNDHYGHPAGDACLHQVAQVFKRRLRRPGDLVARFGGEEFIVVLTGTPLEVAIEAAERLRHALEAKQLAHVGSRVSAYVTVSVGVACARPQDGLTTKQGLITQVDDALYQAKKAGRNRVWSVAHGACA